MKKDASNMIKSLFSLLNDGRKKINTINLFLTIFFNNSCAIFIPPFYL
jgi:hypothetical protein